MSLPIGRPDLGSPQSERGIPAPRPCRILAGQAQQRVRIKQNTTVSAPATRVKRRFKSLRLLQGCHNWGSGWTCGSRVMPLKRLIELSAECLGLAATKQARLTDDLSPKSRANRA